MEVFLEASFHVSSTDVVTDDRMTPTKGGGTPILVTAGSHSGRSGVRATGVRGEGLGTGDERPSPPDSSRKGQQRWAWTFHGKGSGHGPT